MFMVAVAVEKQVVDKGGYLYGRSVIWVNILGVEVSDFAWRYWQALGVSA
jgi:hypothetical protein